MKEQMSARARWCLVAAFAVAMAWMEAATVFYIRALVDRIEPYQANPLPMHRALGNVELVARSGHARDARRRRLARRAHVAAARRLRGARVRRRGTCCITSSFAPISGWPNTLLDWDILFLLPLPWWGPVLAPVSIAAPDDRLGHARDAGGRPQRRRANARWTWALGGHRRRARARRVHGGRVARAAAAGARPSCGCCRRHSTGRCSRSPWR